MNRRIILDPIWLTSENSVMAKFAEFLFSLIHRTAQRDCPKRVFSSLWPLYSVGSQHSNKRDSGR